MRFLFHPAALAEYEESLQYYRDLDPSLAERFVAAIEHTIERIVEMPERWRLVEADVRRGLTHVFPYGILYTVESDYILVLAVMHCSREPGYWHSRRPKTGP